MKKNKSLIWGIILLIVGLMFLGNNLELWKINLFFKGWWTLFIIVPSVISLIKNENINSSILALIIGVLLLLAQRDYIAWNMVGKIFLPFVIITIGISLIFKPKKKYNKKKNSQEYLGIFSGCQDMVTDTFEGASCIAVFGGVELNLSKAKITKDITIETVAIFGGVNIILPKNVILKSEGVSILGGTTNKYESTEKTKSPTVYLNYVGIFGGTEIK